MTRENIRPSSIHVNNLEGPLDLLENNYKTNGKLSIAGNPYNGTVKIAGETVSGVGAALVA